LPDFTPISLQQPPQRAGIVTKAERWRNRPDISGSRKEITIFVEGHSHDSGISQRGRGARQVQPICCVECFLHTITMMNIDINIQHPDTTHESHRGESKNLGWYFNNSKIAKTISFT
jgi:hypothetical protein